jgi:hypothetical protein
LPLSQTFKEQHIKAMASNESQSSEHADDIMDIFSPLTRDSLLDEDDEEEDEDDPLYVAEDDEDEEEDEEDEDEDEEVEDFQGPHPSLPVPLALTY